MKFRRSHIDLNHDLVWMTDWQCFFNSGEGGRALNDAILINLEFHLSGHQWGMIRKCIPFPGISDHDMVLTIADIRAKLQRPIRRKIYLWKNANMDREELESFAETHLSQMSLETPVETQWLQIKGKILSVVENQVPSKMTTCRFSQPWITTDLKQLSRKKKRAVRRSRSAVCNSQSDLTQYKEVKKTMQRKCRKAYQTYISDLICGEASRGGKRFWTYIKDKRCDNTGVSPLLKDGILHCDSQTKAVLLNNQFSSVFTKEDLNSVPDLEASPHPTIRNIEIGSGNCCQRSTHTKH